MSDEIAPRSGIRKISDPGAVTWEKADRETPELYEFGPFRLDLAERRLMRGNEKVELTPKAFDTLVLLVRNSGHLLEKERFFSMLWPDSFVEEGSLSNNIFLLRRALGEDPVFIETVPRRGYRFVGAVRQLPHAAQAQLQEAAPGRPELAKEQLSTHWRLPPQVVAVIIAGALLYPWIAPQIQSYWRLRELQQLKVVPLTALPGWLISPTFSPDGSQIAFVWWNGYPTEHFDLYVKVIGTDMPVRLTHEPFGISGAAWSPDGKNIAFCRRTRAEGSDGEVFLISPLGGPERSEGSDGEVFLISPLGGPERKVSSANCGQQYFGNLLSWSPDGKRLAFPYHPANSPAQHPYRLFVLSLETQEGVAVNSECNAVMRPAFSPRGDYLAWACLEKLSATSIYLQRISDGTVTPLVKGLDGLGGLAWAGDGRRIVYSDSFSGGNLWEVALDRPDQPVRLPFGNDVVDIAVSPAGKRLAIRQIHFNTNIWRVDLSQPQAAAQKVVASTRHQTAGKYSPDGTQIAFESNRSGSNDEVWVSDANGSNAAQLSSFGSLTGTPRWSPDGKLIAFDSRVGGEANIYLVDPHGGMPRKLNIDIRGNNLPSWSHDGKWIYFVNGEDAHNSTVWKVPAEGGHAVQLAQHPAEFPLESPDARHVYFIRDDQLWRLNTDGSDAQQIAVLPRSALDAWVPFGSGIYFWHYTNKPVIDFLDLNTKKVRPVFFPGKYRADWMGGLSVSPDGRWLLFSQVDEPSSNLMMVENWR